MTLFFLHIPRTGGTALRSAFAREFGPDRILSYFTEDGPETSPAAREIMHPQQRRTMLDRLQALSDYVVDHDVGLFASHISAARLACFRPENAFITLRQPIDRLVSEYRYLRGRGATNASFEEHIHEPKRQNMQSRMLGGFNPEQIGVVGVFEDYEDFIMRLNKRFGLQLDVSVENETPLLSKTYLPYCSKAMREKIEELNREDLSLYCNALKQPDSTVSKPND